MAILDKMYDGDVVLETRNRTGNIQIRIKTGPQKYERISSGTDDLKAAKIIADEKYKLITERIEQGLPAKENSRNFSRICSEFLTKLEERKSYGGDKPSDDNYRRVIKKWIVPYFGKMDISKIDETAIANFEEWRLKKMGHVPSKSTINQHNVVLRQLFELAAIKKWRMRNEFPGLTVKGKGVNPKRRPDFEASDLKTLVNFLAVWHLKTDRYATKYKRQMLMCWVGFILMTGVRPGPAEMGPIKWKHVDEDFIDQDGHRAVRILMPHRKTKDDGEIAEIYGLNYLRFYLKKLRDLTGRTDDEDLLFCMPDGSPLKDMSEIFGHALFECGLRTEDEKERHRVPYSLRHTYISEMIRSRKVPLDVLASQTNTSLLMMDQFYNHVKKQLHVPELTGGVRKQRDAEQALKDLVPDSMKEEWKQIDALGINYKSAKENLAAIKAAKD